MASDTRIEWFPGPDGWRLEQKTYAKGGRRYYAHPPNGDKPRMVPGVTSILGAIAKPALLPWTAKQQNIHCGNAAWDNRAALALHAERTEFDAAWTEAVGDVIQAEKTKTEAAEIGTEIHARCEAWTKFWLAQSRGEFPMSPAASVREDVAGAMDEWHRWIAENDVTFLASECGVYSPTIGYCGQVDAIAMLRGERVLVDYKSSKAIHSEAVLQCAAYRQAYTEWYGVEIHGAVIVRLPKLPGEGFETKEIDAATLDASMEVFRAAQTIYRWQQAETQAWRDAQKTEG